MTSLAADSASPAPTDSHSTCESSCALGLIHRLGAFGLALILRFITAGFSGEISHDAAVYYLPNARILCEGGFASWGDMSIAVPPLFPFLIALINPIVGDIELSALVISVICSALVIFPALALAKHYFPTRRDIWIWAIWIAAIAPQAVRYGGSAKGEAIYSLLFAYAFLFGVRLLDNAKGRGAYKEAILFGIFTGLAYLVRPESMGLPIVFVGVIAYRQFVAYRTQQFSRPEFFAWAKKFALAGVVILALMSWNIAFVYNKIGVLTLSPKAGAMLGHDQINEADSSFGKLDDTGMHTALEKGYTSKESYKSFSPVQSFLNNPVGRAKTFIRNLAEFVGSLPSTLGALILLLAFGLPLTRRAGAQSGQKQWLSLLGDNSKAKHQGLWIVFYTLLFYMLVYSMFYVSRRFWLPLTFALFPWFALGAVSLNRFVMAKFRFPVYALFVLLILANGKKYLDAANVVENRWLSSPEKSIGLRISKQFGSDIEIMSNKGRIAWFAEAQHVAMPEGDFEQVMKFARLREIKYMAFDLRKLKRRHPVIYEGIMQNQEQLQLVDQQDQGSKKLRVFFIQPKASQG